MAKKKQQDNALNKTIIWAVVLTVVFAVAYFLTPLINKELRTVEYGNLTFTKTKFGEIPVYYYSYTFKGNSGEINRYNLYLRLNPENNDVPVTGEIEYPKMGKTIYTSMNESSLIGCTNANRELTTLGMFAVGQKYKFELSYLDEETAELRNGKYVTCEKRKDSMVLETSRSNRTIIEKVNSNCYKLEFATCEEFLNVVEKFEVQSLVDAKNRSMSK